MSVGTRVGRGWSGRSMAMAAVGAAVAVGSSSAARAQYRVGADGHLNDVNPRYGSGGYNSATDASYRSALNNQINSANVSGLNYFHGNVQALDPNTVQINSQDAAVQAFTQRSAPVNYAAPSNGQPNFTAYYNTAQYAGPAPSNFVPTRNNVGIIQAPVVSPLNTPYTSDVRLQSLNAPINSASVLPTVQNATGPGPVNPVGDPQVYAMSPLYGIRALQPGDPANDNASYLTRYGTTPRTLGTNPQNSQQTIQKLRAELDASVSNQPVDGSVANGPAAAGVPTGIGVNTVTGDSSAATGAVTGQQVRSAQVSGLNVVNRPNEAMVENRQVTAPVGASLSSVKQTLNVPAGQQSQQVAELQRRFAALNPHPNAVQQTDELNQLQLAIKQGKETAAKKAAAPTPPGQTTPQPANGGRLNFGDSKANPASGNPAARPPDAPTGKGAELPTVVRLAEPPANLDQPFVITSLAAGIRAPGLADLFRQAEDQMRAGQFSQAVDKYDLAGEVAPNNPFVPLGRSFAELGANFYGKAEADLTRAIVSEPAVLAGQYNLQGFLGQDRLRFVQNDLVDIAKTEKTARPHLLLAYIAHNGGQDDAAAKELDAAAAQGGDAHVIGLMRQAWSLKAAGK